MHFRFVKPRDPSLPPLVLLHGSGGTEIDMLPVAAASARGAAAFSVRGAVPCEGGYAFFKRFPDRTIDEGSLRAEVPSVVAFVTNTVGHQFERKPILVGFSNGAIMAAALLMLYPRLFEGAALLRPLPPFAAPPETNLSAMPVLLVEALNDPRRETGDGITMASQLHRLGAAVTHHSLVTGHGVSGDDLLLLKAWFSERE